MISLDWIIQLVTAFIGSFCFGILFNMRGKRLIISAVEGLFAWTCYLILNIFIKSDILNYFLSALLVSGFSQISAKLLKSPASTFTTIAIIPLVPGSSLYYTMAYAFQGISEKFFEKGIYTLKVAAALALGTLLTTAITKFIVGHKKIRLSELS